jgi:hypothetical protein
MLDADLTLQIIDDAATLGIKTIGFTGGEPFVRPRDLRRFFDRVVGYGMETIIITSAFFATSEAMAFRMLEPFANVSMLGLSTDLYHQQFTSIEKVRCAIRAAKLLKIRRIEVQVAFLDPSSVERVREQLGSDADEVLIRAQVVWPIGQAEELIRGSESALVAVDDLDLACPMFGPVVTPDGKVKGCCSSLLHLKDENPLILGDLSREALGEVLKRAEGNGYYTFLKEFGLYPIVRVLRRSDHSGSLKASYTDVCHLCHDIHSNPHARKFLVNEFA